MTMNSKHLLVGLVMLVTASGRQCRPQSAPQNTPPTAQSGSKHAPAPDNPNSMKMMGRIFEQNCARCHNAPDGFSPRISGTVVRHMRVRASLSAHEEQELLRFLNL